MCFCHSDPHLDRLSVKTASASSTYPSKVDSRDTFSAENAIGGSFGIQFQSLPAGYISANEAYPWLQIELKDTSTINHIAIINRKDCCGERLQDLEVRAGFFKTNSNHKGAITANNICGRYPGPGTTGVTINIPCDAPIISKYVTAQQLISTPNYLQIEEIMIYTDSSKLCGPTHNKLFSVYRYYLKQ